MELPLDKAATVGQPTEQQGEGNGRQWIALGYQAAYDPIEGQIAEVSIIVGNFVDAGDGGKIDGIRPDQRSTRL